MFLLIFTTWSLAGSVDTEPAYNYYVIAVQNWCNTTYGIHGLWPQYDNNTYPSYCNSDVYRDVTGKLLEDMTTNWNVDCAEPVVSDQYFWSHEWSKHGSCVNVQTGMNETTYFFKALELFSKLDNNTWTCGQTTDCIVACYDLNFQPITC